MKKKMTLVILAMLVMVNLTGCGLIPNLIGGVCAGIMGLAVQGKAERRSEDIHDIEEFEDSTDEYDYDDYSESSDDYGDYNESSDDYGDYDESGDSYYSEEGLNYTVPYGWELAEDVSTADKKFYVQEGHSNDSQPDNISFNFGSNHYKAEDHVQFRQAILAQLAQHAESDTTMDHINGQGTNTDAGDVLYIFTVTDEDSGMKSVYAYVVGDYKYALFQETNFTGDESVDEDFDMMVRSFVWGD